MKKNMKVSATALLAVLIPAMIVVSAGWPCIDIVADSLCGDLEGVVPTPLNDCAGRACLVNQMIWDGTQWHDVQDWLRDAVCIDLKGELQNGECVNIGLVGLPYPNGDEKCTTYVGGTACNPSG
jgi:hypothetical protein